MSNIGMLELVDSYKYTDIQGKHYEVELWNKPGGSDWMVIMWVATCDIPGSSDWELHWELTGKLVGYRDDSPNIEIREPYTEATAREEFEKWRPK